MKDDTKKETTEPQGSQCSTGLGACPVCGGSLKEMRTKLVCSRCHTICETCCDGGRVS